MTIKPNVTAEWLYRLISLYAFHSNEMLLIRHDKSEKKKESNS